MALREHIRQTPELLEASWEDALEVFLAGVLKNDFEAVQLLGDIWAADVHTLFKNATASGTEAREAARERGRLALRDYFIPDDLVAEELSLLEAVLGWDEPESLEQVDAVSQDTSDRREQPEAVMPGKPGLRKELVFPVSEGLERVDELLLPEEPSQIEKAEQLLPEDLRLMEELEVSLDEPIGLTEELASPPLEEPCLREAPKGILSEAEAPRQKDEVVWPAAETCFSLEEELSSFGDYATFLMKRRAEGLKVPQTPLHVVLIGGTSDARKDAALALFRETMRLGLIDNDGLYDEGGEPPEGTGLWYIEAGRLGADSFSLLRLLEKRSFLAVLSGSWAELGHAIRVCEPLRYMFVHFVDLEARHGA